MDCCIFLFNKIIIFRSKIYLIFSIIIVLRILIILILIFRISRSVVECCAIERHFYVYFIVCESMKRIIRFMNVNNLYCVYFLHNILDPFSLKLLLKKTSNKTEVIIFIMIKFEPIV